MTVGALNVILGLSVDTQSWKEGEARINHFQRLAGVLGALFGGRLLGKALLGFNMGVEDAKNQIASMLALGSQTTMTAQLENANKLYDMLRVKAAALPGTTQDYINMLGLLAQPMAQAKLSLEQMRDVTAGAFVMSKSLGLQWQASARDLADFIKFGKINKTDLFIRTIMTGTGVDATAQGRAKAQKLGVQGRAALVMQQTTGPLAQEMADKLGKSFSGRWETIVDAVQRTLGKVGEGLFEALKSTMTNLTEWFTANEGAIGEWATKVGGYIAQAFGTIQDGVGWLTAHQDILKAFFEAIGFSLLMMAGRAVVAWGAVAWPLFAGAGIIYGFNKLGEWFGTLAQILISVGIAGVTMWLGLAGPLAPLVLLLMLVIKYFHEIVDAVEAAIHAVKKFFGFGAIDDLAKKAGINLDTNTISQEYTGPQRDTPTGLGSIVNNITIQQDTNANIQTGADPHDVKKAIDDSQEEGFNSVMRQAQAAIAANADGR